MRFLSPDNQSGTLPFRLLFCRYLHKKLSKWLLYFSAKWRWIMNKLNTRRHWNFYFEKKLTVSPTWLNWKNLARVPSDDYFQETCQFQREWVSRTIKWRMELEIYGRPILWKRSHEWSTCISNKRTCKIFIRNFAYSLTNALNCPISSGTGIVRFHIQFLPMELNSKDRKSIFSC